MKYRKKSQDSVLRRGLISALSAACLLIGAGCARREALPSAVESPAPAQETASVESEPLPSREVSGPVQEVPEEEGPAPLRVYLENHPFTLLSEDAQLLVAGSYPTIWVTEAGYEFLTEPISEYFSLLREERETEARAFREQALSAIEAGNWNENGYYSTTCTASVIRADTALLSILCEVDSFSGQAHPGTSFRTRTFSAGDGSVLPLRELLAAPEEFPALAERRLLETYDRDIFLADDLAAAIREKWEQDGDLTFTLGYNGLTLWFSPYELSVYAAGTLTVTFPFADYPELILPEFSAVSGSYITPLRSGEDYVLGGGGHLTVTALPADSEDEWELEIAYGTQSLRADCHALRIEPFLVHSGGKNYLYVQRTEENDYRCIDIYTLDEAGIRAQTTFDRWFRYCSPTDPQDMELAARVDLLSSNIRWRDYIVGDDGLPEAISDFDWIQAGAAESLTVRKEFSAELLTEEGSRAEIIPAGTVLDFYATDGEHYVDMRAEDGRIFRLNVEGSWPQTINGADAEELFDGIVYTG